MFTFAYFQQQKPPIVSTNNKLINYNNCMLQQQQTHPHGESQPQPQPPMPLDVSLPSTPTILADSITPKQLLHLVLKLCLALLLTCYSSRLLPDAYTITAYTPEKWQQVDTLQLHDVSPLGRWIRIYAVPVNESEDVDLVHQVQMYSLVDSEEKEKVVEVRVRDMADFVDIGQKTGVRFYFGDLHILADVAYRLKVSKPLKVGRLLVDALAQNSSQTVSESDNMTFPVEQGNSTDTNQTETNTTAEEQAQRRRKQAQQQQKKKEQEQTRKKEQQQRQRQRQQAQRRRQQQQSRRRQQEQQQRIHDHTNIRLQLHQMSNFATILQLFIRYISMLVIVYVAADNPDAPRSLALICAITSNPLLFLQISYPNRLSDFIDCLCRSGPLLYFPVWLFYIHTIVRFPQQTKQKVYLGTKMGLGMILYLVNTLRLLHFQVFLLQTLITIVLIFFVGSYLWSAFLDLQHQHHRNKVLVVVTLGYLGCLFTFKILSGPWVDLMLYVIHQCYGLCVIYLMASPKKLRLKRKKTASLTKESIGAKTVPETFEQLKQQK